MGRPSLRIMLRLATSWVLFKVLHAPNNSQLACSATQYRDGSECAPCPVGAHVPQRWRSGGPLKGVVCTAKQKMAHPEVTLNACQQLCSSSASCQGVQYDNVSNHSVCWVCSNATCRSRASGECEPAEASAVPRDNKSLVKP